MDGESFDRLSVVVHRLRDKATRRSAIGLLFGGSLAAAGTLLGEDAEARKNKKYKNRKRKNCRGFGGWCGRNSDCCYSNCRNGFCWYGGGGGGGGGNKKCGGRRCQNGWKCCKTSGVSVCVPSNYPTCCGNNSYVGGYRCCAGGGACPFGGECCGGFNSCCQSGYKCCGNGRCCPDGWHCGNFVCEYRQSAEIGAESAKTMPFADAVSVDEADWISLAAE